MTIIHLIKKDILIAKVPFVCTILMFAAIPVFFAYAMEFQTGLLSFLYMVILGGITFVNSASAYEAQNPKAQMLLCAAPYTRKMLVMAKYLFFILLFAICYIIHTLINLIINPSNILDLTSVLSVLLISVIINGIYIPIEFKYGNIKAKLIFLVVVMALSFGPMLFVNFLSGIDFVVILQGIAAIPAAPKYFVLALLSVAFFSVSLFVSLRVFSRKEL